MYRSWRETRDARRKGRRDGKAGVPAVDQEALPFDLREILARAEESVHAIVQRWRRDDRALEAELSDLEQQAVDADARLADAEMQRDAALAEHERRKADEDERLVRLQEQLEELPVPETPTFEIDEPAVPTPVAPLPPAPAPAVAAPEDHEPGLDESTDGSAYATIAAEANWRGFGVLVYWPLILLIVLGEIPLNSFAFRLFHEADALTYVMTVTVAVGLVVCAHFLGLLASREERTTVERVGIAVCVAVLIATIAVVSMVRYGYLTRLGDDTGIGPALGTLAFGSINLLVLAAAAGLSYAHHDPRTLVNRRAVLRAGERERSRAERRRAKERRERMERQRRLEDAAAKRAEEQRRRLVAAEHARRERELALKVERHERELQARTGEVVARRERVAEAMRPIREAARERLERIDELNRLVEDARAALGQTVQRIGSIAAERRALRESVNVEVRAERAARERLVATYCSANVRARAMHDSPRCFEAIPPLEVPDELEAAVHEVAR